MLSFGFSHRSVGISERAPLPCFHLLDTALNRCDVLFSPHRLHRSFVEVLSVDEVDLLGLLVLSRDWLAVQCSQSSPLFVGDLQLHEVIVAEMSDTVEGEAGVRRDAGNVPEMGSGLNSCSRSYWERSDLLACGHARTSSSYGSSQ